MRSFAADVERFVVCVTVLGTRMRCAKMAEPIVSRVTKETRVGLRN